MQPNRQLMTRDMVALGQGFWTPPHCDILADTFVLQQPAEVCDELGKIAKKAGSHLARKARKMVRPTATDKFIFIGHGGSRTWKDLKDFIQDRLSLHWDEFNREPAAGKSNVARLTEMLDSAAFAFIVLTGEDERLDGKLQARQNAVHEAGLFQGRLGFNKAIVMLEDGCEEFGNIHGLVQIRFPKDSINAVFEEIRRVLEREKLIHVA
jgi:predicted nucleotide-binding protein